MIKSWQCVFLACLIWGSGYQTAYSQKEADYYKISTVSIPGDIELEVGGLAFADDGSLGVTTRRGEVWLIKNPGSSKPDFIRFARGMHEPLGLAYKNNAFYLAQRGELTRLRDEDGDDRADHYDNIYTWDLAGNYHEYAYGPVFLDDGSMLITLNLGWVGRGASLSKWSGWMLRVTEDGKMTPVATGMRSPAGFGLNAAGDIFYTENQGDWVGSGRMTHVEEGDFVGHPEGLKWSAEEGSPVSLTMSDIQDTVETTLYAYSKQKEGIKPPSVWFPHTIMGISTSDIVVIPDGYGPFAGQLLVGDQGHSKIMRVYQEKVKGEYQGICFPFVEGFSSGVLRLAWSADNQLYVGMTNRGWASTGKEPFGIQRLSWTGNIPFEMETVSIEPDGFRITFTEPVDRRSAANPDSYAITDFNYKYHHFYGSPAIDQRERTVFKVEVAENNLSVRLYVEGLREGYINEIKAEGVKSAEGKELLHNTGYYTINKIPEGERIQSQESQAIKENTIVEAVELSSSKRVTQMPADWTNGPDVTLTLTAVAGMKYDKIMLTAKAGSKVRLVFNNPDDMMHNVLIVKPGTADEVGEIAARLGLRGEQMGFIPESDMVLYHTNLLRPNSSDTVYFIAPDEPGRYQYVCTFPGHSATMRGILRITP